MAETPATRRHFLRTGALVAAVLAVVLVAAACVPPKPPPPPSRTFTFSNNEFVTFDPPDDHPRCSGSDEWSGVAFRMSFSKLGKGDVTILACIDRINNFNPPFNVDLRDGLVTIVFGGRVLSGTGSGRVFLVPITPIPPTGSREATHLDIEFTGGTGALAGATGVATYDRLQDFLPPPLHLPTTNTFSGSITVPGA